MGSPYPEGRIQTLDHDRQVLPHFVLSMGMEVSRMVCEHVDLTWSVIKVRVYPEMLRS